jgi:hypothetical protein
LIICFVAAFELQPAATGGTTLFGAQPQSAAAGMFGQTNKPLFGTATNSNGGGFGVFDTSTSTGTTSLSGAQNKVGLLVHIYISALGRVVCLISPAQPAMISRVGGVDFIP